MQQTTEQEHRQQASGPEFIVIGAAKSATSSLCVALQYHPAIHIPQKKELNFFSHDQNYRRGHDWYHGQFSPSPGAICGEGSVSYSFYDAHPETSVRIHAYRPDMKFIYIVRDPIARLVSLYHQFQAAGVLGPVSFGEALRSHIALLDSARYWKQISAYRRLFPDSQIQILFFEDWKENPADLLGQCCDFLGVERRTDLHVSKKGQTHGQRRDSRLLWAMRSKRGFGRVRNMLPEPVRGFLRNFLKTPIARLPDVTPDTREFLREELTEDIEQFLSWCGRPNFWSLQQDMSSASAA